MAMGKRTGIATVFTVALCLLGSCAGSKLKVEPIAISENPIEQVNRLDKEIENARNNKLDVLAPIWFGKSETSLNEARKGLERGDELSEIFEKVADGRAQLSRAEEMGQLVRTAG